MSKYKLYNLIFGWLSFLIATIVFVLTMEPTVSFWDCGEFISASYKLQVMHPPGAPFFGMVVRMFTLFAFGNVENVAYLANLSSALCSSFTILFMFWTITHLARKIFDKTMESTPSAYEMITIFGTATVGALIYTFSDTFWFSAAETEVYAMSSLFTAIVFWAILKWENVAHEKGSDRWLVFISFLIGLSIGVHLLGLLAVPAIAYVYYFKRYEATRKGFIYTGIISVAILGGFNLLAPTLASFAATFDRIFVNGFGMFFGSGMIFFMILLGVGLFYAVKWSMKNHKVALNTALWCGIAAIVGCGTYAMTVIRSDANPPIDMNDPENAYNLLSYINREQYGEHHLLSGGHFAVTQGDWVSKETSKTIWKRVGDKYEDRGKKVTREYKKSVKMLFPRVYSHDRPSHISFYKAWLKIPDGVAPTMQDNIKFFWTYQMNFMYWRYFMWNFAGRENNVQGHGLSDNNGQWISGIDFIDEARLGSRDALPSSITNNPAHNKYFFLPLILGLFGMFFQFKRNNKDAWTVFLLFFFTGIAIVLYLNQYPLQPRERDYAYAASFYAFAIWIGFGVMAITEFLRRYVNGKVAATVTTVVCLAVPAIMAEQGWDDHDRSNKYTARDIAKNYLESCRPNAVLFTLGDNDTYPLWYIQEVEGYRKDVRIVNLSLLGTSWYVDHMKTKYHADHEGIPSVIEPIKYLDGNRDYMPFAQQTGVTGYLDLKRVLEFVISDDRRTKGGPNAQYDLFPTKKVSLQVDRDAVIATGTIPTEVQDRIVSEMQWDLKGGGVIKDDLIILDVIANNNWERPIYFATTIGRIGSNEFNGLDKYFHQAGLTYQVLPVENRRYKQRDAEIMKEEMFQNMINEYQWTNLATEKINIDPETSRMVDNLRGHFYALAAEFMQVGKNDTAKLILDTGLEKVNEENFGTDGYLRGYASLYFRLGENKKAADILRRVSVNLEEEIAYYNSFTGQQARMNDRNLQQRFGEYRNLIQIAQQSGADSVAKELGDKLKTIEGTYSGPIK
ncbi:MAG: hypothetical protein ACJAZ3_000137 [Sphingobacteriales bacterium]|jgi:hypothetical protein